MLLHNLTDKNIILASKSPRRQQLMQGLEIPFVVRTKDVDESFPETLKAQEIALFLSVKKAQAFREDMRHNDILITADTIVWINNRVLNKPADRDEAKAMLSELSGAVHMVYTGMTVASFEKEETFYDETRVHFARLTPAEIDYYIDRYEPFDKAGGYGVQEFIGYIGIKRLEGSYFNVMGLPVHKLYEVLRDF